MGCLRPPSKDLVSGPWMICYEFLADIFGKKIKKIKMMCAEKIRVRWPKYQISIYVISAHILFLYWGFSGKNFICFFYKAYSLYKMNCPAMQKCVHRWQNHLRCPTVPIFYSVYCGHSSLNKGFLYEFVWKIIKNTKKFIVFSFFCSKITIF